MSQQVGNEKITPHTELPWEHRAGNILYLESPRYGQVAAFELERDAEYALVACNAYPDLVAEIERLRLLVAQYRSDLRHPPAPDSRERRLKAIDEALSPTEPARRG